MLCASRANEQVVLNELRGSQGVRLQNCELNVGRPKYAFSPVQLRALPEALRPPAATAQSGKA